jgi:hypothetical protein
VSFAVDVALMEIDPRREFLDDLDLSGVIALVEHDDECESRDDVGNETLHQFPSGARG